MEKYHRNEVSPVEKENERDETYKASNPQIDSDRTKNNYHIIKGAGSYNEYINKRIRELNLPQKSRKDAVLMASFVIGSDGNFFDGLSEYEQQRFLNKLLMLHKCEHTRDLVRCLVGAEQYATDYPVECIKDYDLFSEFFDWVNNSDVLEDLDEFARISHFDNIFNRILEAGYIILIGNENQYSKHKLNTSFVFLRTKEDFEKNKLML